MMVMISYQLINGMCGNQTFKVLDEQWIRDRMKQWLSWSILEYNGEQSITDAVIIACGRNPLFYPIGMGGRPDANINTPVTRMSVLQSA